MRTFGHLRNSVPSPVRAKTLGALDGSFGPDRHRRLVVTLADKDLLVITPERTRRHESISIFDVYRYAMRCRVNRELLEKARLKKERKAEARARARIARADAKLRKEARGL